MKYPKGIKTNKIKNINYANRGMGLEEDINLTNEQYRLIDKALIYKKPTPITICKVDYSSKIPIIKEAVFRTPSTTDYNGVYKGIYLDFEAKETKLKRFPLKNIHKHQIEHLKRVTLNKGIAFIIVKFVSIDETYMLSEEKLTDFIDNYKESSIPLNYFKENGYLISTGFNPRIDYLKTIDVYIKEKKNEKEV